MLVIGGATQGPNHHLLEGQAGQTTRLVTQTPNGGFSYHPSRRSGRKQPPTYPFGPTAAATKGSSSNTPHADAGIGCLYIGVNCAASLVMGCDDPFADAVEKISDRNPAS